MTFFFVLLLFFGVHGMDEELAEQELAEQGTEDDVDDEQDKQAAEERNLFTKEDLTAALWADLKAFPDGGEKLTQTLSVGYDHDSFSTLDDVKVEYQTLAPKVAPKAGMTLKIKSKLNKKQEQEQEPEEVKLPWVALWNFRIPPRFPPRKTDAQLDYSLTGADNMLKGDTGKASKANKCLYCSQKPVTKGVIVEPANLFQKLASAAVSQDFVMKETSLKSGTMGLVTFLKKTCIVRKYGCWAFSSAFLNTVLTGRDMSQKVDDSFKGQPNERPSLNKIQVMPAMLSLYYETINVNCHLSEPWIRGEHRDSPRLKIGGKGNSDFWTYNPEIGCTSEWITLDGAETPEQSAFQWLTKCLWDYESHLKSVDDLLSCTQFGKHCVDSHVEDCDELRLEIRATWLESGASNVINRQSEIKLIDTHIDKALRTPDEVDNYQYTWGDVHSFSKAQEHFNGILQYYRRNSAQNIQQAEAMHNFLTKARQNNYVWGTFGLGVPRSKVAPFHWIPFGLNLKKKKISITTYDTRFFTHTTKEMDRGVFTMPLGKTAEEGKPALLKFINDFEFEVRYMMVCKHNLR